MRTERQAGHDKIFREILRTSLKFPHFLPIECSCMFRIYLRKKKNTAIISQHSINWLVYIAETECVYCAVRTGYLYIIQVMCFVWI